MTHEFNRTATAGHNAILDRVREDDIAYDPFGTARSWAFAIADVTYVRFGEILPEYSPSPMLDSDTDLSDEQPDGEILEMLDSGEVTQADLVSAFTVLSRMSNWAKASGRSY